MKVLLLGSGGREHALFWKLSQSRRCSAIDVFPGNGGFPEESILSHNLDFDDLSSIRKHVEKQGYDLVVVGPEQPLVDGIADLLTDIVPVFGPSRAAARLEGSKEFSKALMKKYSIPTAEAEIFTEKEWAAAAAYLQKREPPIVIKADGLAAGKGVTVAWDHKEALTALREALIEKRFGAAGSKVLIEEFLPGEELSIFALCDGEKLLTLQACQDYKRAYENNKGPNTGGMGSYTPVPLISGELMQQIRQQILEPLVRGMREEGNPYRGLLYAGLMVTGGRARVVEFNVRFGDPETQPLLCLLDADLLELLYQTACGRLQSKRVPFFPQTAVTTVLAAEGYPQEYSKGIELKNMRDGAWQENGVVIFHAGTRREAGRLVSSGGRVLNVTAAANSMAEARQKVYDCIEEILVPGLFYRRDIGLQQR